MVKDAANRSLSISVKGSQGKSWPLAASLKKEGVSYLEAIDTWVAKHRPGTIVCLVPFLDVAFDAMPPIYGATPASIAAVMNAHGKNGHGALHLADVPAKWRLTSARLARLFTTTVVGRFVPGDLVLHFDNDHLVGTPHCIDEVKTEKLGFWPWYQAHAIRCDDPCFAGEPVVICENRLEPL
jgi:hypothetical protein